MSVIEATCAELVELVTDYLEGALGKPEETRLERHLDDCSGCRAYLEQMRQTIRLLGRLPEASLRSEEAKPLLELFRRWHDEGSA